MSGSLVTKQALANSLKELMDKRSFSKISVKDIVEKCGMNRKSFYYHFKDKYDLVNWIYYTEFVAEFQDEDYMSHWEIIEKICEFLYKNKSFYSNVLEVRGQNSFYEYFGEILASIIAIQFEDIFEDSEYKEFYITFFVDAIRTSITKWLLEGGKIPPKTYTYLLKNVATGIVLKVNEDMEYNN